MTENGVIEKLVDEHRSILAVVQGLGAAAGAIRNGKAVDAARLQEVVGFMRDYADRFHHAKEEDLVFPSFVAHGVPPHGCPIDALLAEHRRGRELVRALDAGIAAYARAEPEAGHGLAETIDAMVALYTDHIWKEDNMVFPMAEHLLPVAERARLAACAADVTRAFDPDFEARSENFARSFAAEAPQA